MSIGKDTKSSLYAYTGILKGLKLGQGFFAKLNYEYMKLLLAIFRRLIETNSLDRQDEFFDDFMLFGEDMKRKYSTTSPLGYTPRSPFEKRMGLSLDEGKSKKVNHKMFNEDDLDDLSMDH